MIDAGKVLLLRRGNWPALGKWTFPGGYVDFGENAAEAAIRETREEVGMRVEPDGLLGVFSDQKSPALTIVVYLAKPGEIFPFLQKKGRPHSRFRFPSRTCGVPLSRFPFLVKGRVWSLARYFTGEVR